MNSTDPASAATGQMTLPELTDALLDAPTLEQLFRDLASCTEVLEVIAKGHPQQMVAPQPRLTLDDARALLTSGAVRGVQVRYRYDGAQWWDTLMATPAGVRLVRIRHDHFS